MENKIHRSITDDINNDVDYFSDVSILNKETMLKLINKRYEEVQNYFDDKNPNSSFRFSNYGGYGDVIDMEGDHKKFLEELAVKLVCEEYNVPKNKVIFDVKLESFNPNEINYNHGYNNGYLNNAEELTSDIEKRKIINAMIQGSSKRSTHMYHKATEEIKDKLGSDSIDYYNKFVSTANLLYFKMRVPTNQQIGYVKVTLPKKRGDKTTIKARATVFPILIHEITKGIMELLSANGLPKDELDREYVLGKADVLNGEPSCMRMGVGIWDNFLKTIPVGDFHLKSHIFNEICLLESSDFLSLIKGIIESDDKSKERIKKIILKVKKEL